MAQKECRDCVKLQLDALKKSFVWLASRFRVLRGIALVSLYQIETEWNALNSMQRQNMLKSAEEDMALYSGVDSVRCTKHKELSPTKTKEEKLAEIPTE